MGGYLYNIHPLFYKISIKKEFVLKKWQKVLTAIAIVAVIVAGVNCIVVVNMNNNENNTSIASVKEKETKKQKNEKKQKEKNLKENLYWLICLLTKRNESE